MIQIIPFMHENAQCFTCPDFWLFLNEKVSPSVFRWLDDLDV